MLLVMAGRYIEYTTFIRKHKLRNGIDARYISDHRQIRGFARGTQFIRIGTWWNRRDSEEMFDTLCYCGYQEIETMVDLKVRNLVLLFNGPKSYVKALDLMFD